VAVVASAGKPQTEAVEAAAETGGGLLPRWVFPTLLGVIMVGAFVLRIWGIRMGLPLQMHPDEWRVVARAMAMGTGDLDPHTTEVGALMIYVCFFLFAMYGGLGILFGHFANVHDIGVSFCSDPTAFYLIARSVSLVSGLLGVYFLYRAGKELGGKWGGLVAAGLLAVHPIHVERSHLAYPDAMMVCLMAAALMVMARADQEQPKLKTDLVVGLLIGLATAAKYLGAFVLPVYVVWRVISLWGGGLVIVLKHTTTGCVACAAGFFMGMPTFLLRIAELVGGTSGPRALGGISGAITGATTWELSSSNIIRRVWKDIYTAKGIGPLATALAALGAIWGGRRRPALTIGLMVGLALNVVWVARLARFMPRWIFPTTLALCVLAPMGVPLLHDLINRLSYRRVLAWTGACLVPLMLWPQTTRSMEYVSGLTGPDTRILATAWVEENIAPGTAILLDGATYSIAQPLPNRESLQRMLSAATGIENPRYAHISDYYQFQIEALDRCERPTYDIYRLSHVWFRPRVPADSDIHRQRDEIPVVPGREMAVPFEEYVRRGVQYAIVSQGSVEHYRNDRFPLDQQFYEDLFAGSELVRRFSAGDGVSGPEILILRIRGDEGEARERAS